MRSGHTESRERQGAGDSLLMLLFSVVASLVLTALLNVFVA